MALHAATGTDIAVKLGSGGALLCGSQGTITAPGAPVTSLDVTGAGDSFAAAFLSSIAGGASPHAALQAAVRFSAAKVQLAGTQPRELLDYCS